MDRELRRQIALKREDARLQRELEEFKYVLGIEREAAVLTGRLFEQGRSHLFGSLKWLLSGVILMHAAFVSAMLSYYKPYDAHSTFRLFYVNIFDVRQRLLFSAMLLAGGFAGLFLYASVFLQDVSSFRDRAVFRQKLNKTWAGTYAIGMSGALLCTAVSGLRLLQLILDYVRFDVLPIGLD